MEKEEGSNQKKAAKWKEDWILSESWFGHFLAVDFGQLSYANNGKFSPQHKGVGHGELYVLSEHEDLTFPTRKCERSFKNEMLVKKGQIQCHSIPPLLDPCLGLPMSKF